MFSSRHGTLEDLNLELWLGVAVGDGVQPEWVDPGGMEDWRGNRRLPSGFRSHRVAA